MKFGIQGGPLNDPSTDPVLQAQKYESLGFDSVWWPDHIMGWVPKSGWEPKEYPLASLVKSPHIYYEPTTTVAAASMVTRKITLGICVTDLIRRHPATLAHTALTLDRISNGRTVLGLGAGTVENLVPYGLTFEKAVDKTVEGMKVLRLLLTRGSDPITFDGKYFSLKDAILDLEPTMGRSPPIWIAAHGERMLRLVGRSGDGWVPGYLSPGDYKKRWRLIEEASRKASRDPRRITKAIFIPVITDSSHEVCERLATSSYEKTILMAHISAQAFELKTGKEHPLGANFRGMRDYLPTLSKEILLDSIRKIPDDLCKERVMYGTPSEIIEKLEKYSEAGVQEVIFWNRTFFGDTSKLDSSFKHLKEIASYFREGSQ